MRLSATTDPRDGLVSGRRIGGWRIGGWQPA
jgi:hypothetical protein